MSKSRTLFASKKTKIAVVGIATILGLCVGGFVIHEMTKNRYDVQIDMRLAEESSEVIGSTLKLEVESPKGESIILKSEEDPMLISPEALESFVSEDVEVKPLPESEEAGVELKIKANTKKVNIELPIPSTEKEKVTIRMVRDGRTIKKLRLKQPKEEATETSKAAKAADAQAKKPTVEEIEAVLTSKNVLAQNVALDKAPRMTRVVTNYTQFAAAVADRNVSRIILGAHISGTAALATITRSLEIEGAGHTLTLNTSTTALWQFNLGVVTGSQQFTLKNVNINFNSNYYALVHSYAAYSVNWTVNLENVSHVTMRNAGPLLVDVSRGAVTLRGLVNWDARNSVAGPSAGATYGLLKVSRVYITDGAKVILGSKSTVIRMYPAVLSDTTSFFVDKGSVVLIYSENRQGIYANYDGATNEVQFNVQDKGTVVDILSHGILSGAEGGTIALVGSNEGMKNSFTRVAGGAVVNCHSLAKNTSVTEMISQPAFVNQVKQGMFILDGEGSELNLESDGEPHDYGGTFRFRLVGEQTFMISNKAKLTVEKRSGQAAAIRLYGKSNKFNILSGGQVHINNYGTGWAVNGGDVGGQQGIQFTIDTLGVSSFNLSGFGSELVVKTNNGPAMEAQFGDFAFNISDNTIFRLEGSTASADRGTVHAGGSNITINMNNPLYYDFQNTRTDGGQVFSTASLSASQTFVSKGSNLFVWEKRAGVDIYRTPHRIWWRLDYSLGNKDFKDILSTNLPAQFNSWVYKGTQHYTRMSGDNWSPVVDEIYTPTNADKRVYGHVSVPFSLDGKDKRDALHDEVWVTVVVKDKNGKEIQRNVASTKDNTRIFDGRTVRNGIFSVQLNDFLREGDTVEVVAAHRGPSDPNSDQTIHSKPEDIQTGVLTTQDVRPPETLTADITEANNIIKEINGTIDLYDAHDNKKMNKVFIYAMTDKGYLKDANGNTVFVEVNDQSPDASASSTTVKKWKLYLPRYLEVDDKTIELVAKDDANPTGIPDLQATTGLEGNGVMGNSTLPLSLANSTVYPGYHDATGSEKFQKNVSLKVEDVIPAQPIVKIQADNATHVDSSGNLVFQKGLQFTYKVTVESGDAAGAKKPSISNLRVEMDISDRLEYLTHNRLLNTPSIKDYQFDQANGKLYMTFNPDLDPGGKFEFSLEARVPEGVANFAPLTTNVVAVGNTPRETPFVPGPVNPLADREETSGSASLTITSGDAVEKDDVYLSVINKRVNVFYSNISEFKVYIDGKHYKDYTVTKRKNVESVVIDFPIDEIRNKISVKYKASDGREMTAIWNDNWDFVQDKDNP